MSEHHRLRVALINYRDDAAIGGSLRVMEGIARHLDPAETDAHLVFAYGGPGPVSQSATRPCHYLGSQGPRDLRGWLRARAFFQKLQVDILHFHAPVYWLQTATLGLGCPRLLHVHGPLCLDDMPLHKRLLWKVSTGLAAGQVCLTETMRRAVLASRIGRRDRSWTLHNAIDCDHFSQLPDHTATRRALNLPPDCFLLGMVCSLVWWKGCDDAIHILRRLDSRFHLAFCGSGPEQGRLEALAREQNVEHRVHFLGLMNDVRIGYAAMDAFLFLSRFEPFGLVIAEAMAAGVPIFGLGGEGEYREPEYPLVTGQNACFVERRKPAEHRTPEHPEVLNELAQRIADFARDPRQYDAVSHNARWWVRKHFDIPPYTENLAELYRTMAHVS